VWHTGISMKPRSNNLPCVEVLVDRAPQRVAMADLTDSLLARCQAVRAFRWHKGQRHFPGMYWASTTRAFVGYESRLELSRLLLADHDPDVAWIVSQPFRLIGQDDLGRIRRHVPDYALLYSSDSTVRIVNVKPAERVANPEVRAALSWANGLLESVGFATEVWSTVDPTVLSNIRFLAGFRNPALFHADDVEAVVRVVGHRLAWRDAEASLGSGIPQPRAAMLHALWLGRLRCDLSVPIGTSTTLEAS